MTRIFTDGAEAGDVLFWTSDGQVSSVRARSGTYSYLWGKKVLSSALSEFYMRVCVYIETTGDVVFMAFSNGVNNLVELRHNTLHQVTAWVGGSEVAIGTTKPMKINKWHTLDIHIKVDDAAGIIHIYLDDIEIINFNGDTKPGADVDIDTIWCTWGYFDDLGLNDTAGGVDDSWLADEHIEALLPNDNGDVNDWTGSDGDKVNNYLLVDERPPNSDTDYVHSGTATEQDMYHVSDYVATKKTVERVYTEIRARDQGAAAGQIKIGLKTGGSVYLSAAITLGDTYSRQVGDEYLVNPFTTVAWVEADLDAVQAVIECQ